MNQSTFVDHLKQLNVDITETQLDQLNKYYELLVSWNEVMNLTTIIEEEQVYLKHFYDSVTLVKVIDFNKINNFCDIGTGAGFPGLVIKIMFPNLKVTLVDSLNKRITFLNDVISKLDLKNIETIHARAEDYATNNKDKFDVVSVRAVSSLNILLEYCIPITKISGYFVPMKANISQEIIDATTALKTLDCEIVDICNFNLPIENSERNIIKIQKKSKTNSKYPRKTSEIKKNPL